MTHDLTFLPRRVSKRRLPRFLPAYPVPKALRDCLEAKSDVLVVQPCLGEVSMTGKRLVPNTRLNNVELHYQELDQCHLLIKCGVSWCINTLWLIKGCASSLNKARKSMILIESHSLCGHCDCSRCSFFVSTVPEIILDITFFLPPRCVSLRYCRDTTCFHVSQRFSGWKSCMQRRSFKSSPSMGHFSEKEQSTCT